MAGAPIGNKNGAKGAVWRAALEAALARYEKNGVRRGQALREIAMRVIDQALEGNSQAIQELANRLDGKPAQSLHVSGDVQHSFIQVLAEYAAMRDKQISDEQQIKH